MRICPQVSVILGNFKAENKDTEQRISDNFKTTPNALRIKESGPIVAVKFERAQMLNEYLASIRPNTRFATKLLTSLIELK